MVEPTTTPAVAASLARRLRELRLSGFPHARLTQGEVAQALSAEGTVGISTLSAWENTRTPTLPSRDRLSSYARLFATERSLEEPRPHLVPLAELSPAEHEARQELERELFRLRDDDAGELPSPRQSWRFEDGAPITVICSDLSKSDEVKLGPLSDVDNPNYTELYSYADLDALDALLRHLHSSNPHAEIRRCLASQATGDDLVNHLVLLGGIAWNDTTRRLNDRAALPVRQVRNEKIQTGEVFEAVGDPNHLEQFMPLWQEDDPGTAERPGVLLEDVGMLARVPNPFNARRKLTYCNGIHSRGVLGAVKCLTDVRVRDDNERYLEEAFLSSDRFVILMRVQVLGSQTISPSLRSPGTVRFQWSDAPRGN
ncbi:MAG TPA: helix-turn-helix domain-containing protein [Streptosporangiaceae bacterium]|nr:helix-turn-helix domain-containing protein [Streptosporangiaceae bacterium]